MAGLKGKKKKWLGSYKTTLLWSPVLLLVLFLLGFFTPFYFLAGPVFGIAYFFRKRGLTLSAAESPFHRNGDSIAKVAPAIIPAVRGAIMGTIITLAVFAPLRTVVSGIIWFSGFEPLQASLMELSEEGFVDAWMGVFGVSFAILLGLMTWGRGLRLKSQIENIPTSTVRSAAIGLTEFKGVARPIDDESKRLTEKIVDGEKKKPPKGGGPKKNKEPILYSSLALQSQTVTEIWSRFYLEDETGRILVDPRGADFWDGHGHFLWSPIRSLYLEKRRQLNETREVRSLLPGDPVYVIGSVEENKEAGQDASELDRLILRPSSTLKSTDLLRRIMLGKDKKSQGTDIYDVFFLTDLQEVNAKDALTKGMKSVWIWMVAWVALSLPLILVYGDKLFEWKRVLWLLDSYV